LPVPVAAEAASSLDETTLETIRRVVDPAQRASLLLDAVEACQQAQRCQEPATERLQEIAAAVRGISEPFRKVDLLLRLSRLEQQLGLFSEASNTRTEAREVVMASDEADRGALLLKLGLAAEEAENSGEGERLLAEAAERMNPSSASRLSFPFKPLPATVKLGFAVSGTTFRDDTALGAINLDYYKQGEREDLEIDLAAALSYDSSRSENTFRPNGLGVLVYRRHLDAKWNLFFGQLATVNNDTFSSRNDDNDLSVLTASLIGAGYNLWRGEKPSSFVEVQIGAGVRYEYEELDSVEILNEAAPNLALILRARELKLGRLRLNQTLSIGSLMDDWSNAFLWSTTSIQLPLTERWSWTNTLLLRYRTQPVDDNDPNLNASFASGLTYTF
jgi:putative salt-induced outer membrane protein YdiY